MRLALQTVICCCVFTTVLPLVKGTPGELNTSLKKRFRVWLQSRMKRDLHNSLVTDKDRLSDIHVGPQQDGNVSPPSSFRICPISANIRPRRSASSQSSVCFLVTCAYHDLVYRLQVTSNRQNQENAPDKKIGSTGYGRRRRRSLQDVTQLPPQTEDKDGALKLLPK